MKFPSILDVAKALRQINRNVEGECDVRIQVYDDSEWALRWGDSSYDQDHRGYWGASSVPGVNKHGRETRFDSKATAKDMIEQAKDQYGSR